MLAALVFSAAAPAQSLERCTACHGPDGNSIVPGVPSIAAQPRLFLEHYLVLTREGLRGSEVMQHILKGVSDPEIVAMAAHFERMPAKPQPGPTDPGLFRRGGEVAARHHCGSCHRPDYLGQQQMPRLAGQREDFLIESMLAYQQNKRPGGDTIMAAALYGIPEADIRAMAHFLATLPAR
jgi:cytochrome c553